MDANYVYQIYQNKIIKFLYNYNTLKKFPMRKKQEFIYSSDFHLFFCKQFLQKVSLLEGLFTKFQKRQKYQQSKMQK